MGMGECSKKLPISPPDPQECLVKSMNDYIKTTTNYRNRVLGVGYATHSGFTVSLWQLTINFRLGNFSGQLAICNNTMHDDLRFVTLRPPCTPR